MRDQAARLAQLVADGGMAAVLFHARWCPFCRTFQPVFEEVAARLGGFEPLEVLLDDEANPLWASHRIRVVPTVVFFAGGRELHRLEAGPGIGLSAYQLERAWGEAARVLEARRGPIADP